MKMFPCEKGFESSSEFPAYHCFAEYFENQGYKTRVNNKWSDIVPKKFRKLLGIRGGDVDIIAKKDDDITIVEIKHFWSGDLLRAAKFREKIADFIYFGLISSRHIGLYPYGILELHYNSKDNSFYVMKTKASERFYPDSIIKKVILKQI